MEKLYDELDLHALIRACFRKIRLLLVLVLAGTVCVAAYLAIKLELRPDYVSDSVLCLAPGQKTAPSADGVDVSTIMAAAGSSDSAINLIKNRWLLYEVIRQAGLELQFAAEGVDMDEFIRESIAVTTVSSTPYLKVEVHYGDPETAHALNQGIISLLPDTMKTMGITSQLIVIDYPVVPAEPRLPKKWLIAVVAAALVGVVFLLAVLVDELAYTGLRTRLDVERELEVPLLAALPRLSRRKSGVRRNLRYLDSLKRELGAMLFRLAKGGKQHCVCLFAREHDRSFMEASLYLLASTAAGLGYKVQVINGGGIKNSFYSLYRNMQSSVTDIDHPFDVAEPEKEVKNPPAYDFVFANMTAERGPGALALTSEQMDGVVVFLRHNGTSRTAAKRVDDLLAGSGAPLCGAVFTDVSTAWPCSYFSGLAPEK